MSIFFINRIFSLENSPRFYAPQSFQALASVYRSLEFPFSYKRYGYLRCGSATNVPACQEVTGTSAAGTEVLAFYQTKQRPSRVSLPGCRKVLPFLLVVFSTIVVWYGQRLIGYRLRHRPLCHSPKESLPRLGTPFVSIFPFSRDVLRSLGRFDPEIPAHLHYGTVDQWIRSLSILVVNDRDSDSSGKVEESRWETHRPQ